MYKKKTHPKWSKKAKPQQPKQNWKIVMKEQIPKIHDFPSMWYHFLSCSDVEAIGQLLFKSQFVVQTECKLKTESLKLKELVLSSLKKKNTVKISKGNIWISLYHLKEVVKLHT